MTSVFQRRVSKILKSRFCKFVGIGGFSALQNIFFLYLLTRIFHIHYIVATIVIGLFTNSVAFLLNRYFTFSIDTKQNFWKEFFKYHTVMISSMLSVLVLMFICVGLLKIDVILANIIITIGMTLYNFLLHRKWTFSGK